MLAVGKEEGEILWEVRARRLNPFKGAKRLPGVVLKEDKNSVG